MKNRITTLVNTLIALYAVIGSILFFIIQTAKLFRYDAAEKEMLTQPMGLFDWGFVWADTMVSAPFLLAGGILLLVPARHCRRIGTLLTFSGFALNLYAMITLWIGLWKLGHPMTPGEFWFDFGLTLLGILGMIFLAFKKDRVNEST